MDKKSYLEFHWIGDSPSGKTSVYHVQSKTTVLLGTVKWFSQWRKYCFYPAHSELVFDAGCLREIAEFLDELKKGRKDGASLSCD